MPADIPIITGTLGSESFQFFIDGVATFNQTERLIGKIDALVKRFKAEKFDNQQMIQEREKEVDLIAESNNLRDKNNDSVRDNTELLSRLHQASGLLEGNFRSLLRPLNHTSASLVAIGAAVGGFIGLVQNMFDYSNMLGQAMQRGVAGGVMDFAIAAKSGGLTLAQFNKALEASGGSFALLGGNATEGAKNFGNLVKQVRTATASLGNLGLTNEQQAEFAAQQLKIAIGQGMKGRQAQDFVVRSSQKLATELDDLASRTGKSVLELAKEAMKVSSDPLVTSFVKSVGAMGQNVSEAVQKLTANYTALFGENGAKAAEDLVRSTFAGLPFQVSQVGKDLIGITNETYAEMERQAKMAQRGEAITEADRERLRTIILKETRERGELLRLLAAGTGPQAEAAKRILAMAQAAEQYSDKDITAQKKRDKVAKDFMAESNKLKATLQELAVPFLQMLNGIDWAFMFSVLNGFAKTVEFLLSPLKLLGTILGDTGAGTLIGGALAVGGVLGGLYLIFKNLAFVLSPLGKVFELLTGSVKKVIELFGNLIKVRTLGGIAGDKASPLARSGRSISIDAGFGTNPARPLFVWIVGGNKGRRGAGPGVGPLGGGPLDDILGDAADRKTASNAPGYRKGAKERLRELRSQGMSPEEARRRYEIEQRGAAAGGQVRDFFKNNKVSILSAAAILAGGFASMYGGKILEEDPESTTGKVIETAGSVTENLGLWGGLLLHIFPGITDKLKSFGTILWDFGKGIKDVGLLNTLKSWGGMISNTAMELGQKFLPKVMDAGSKVLDFGKSITASGLKKLPLIGGLITGGIEYAQSGSLGRSIFSGLGTMLGGLGGGFLGSLVAPGLGTAAGGIAGGVAGEKAGTALYDWLFGKKKTEEIKPMSDKVRIGGQKSPLTVDEWANIFSEPWKAPGLGQGGVAGTPSNPVAITFADPAQFEKMAGTLPDAQKAAIELASLKTSEEKANNSRMLSLLEEIRNAGEASAAIQSKGIGIADSSNKYLRDQRLYSGQA